MKCGRTDLGVGQALQKKDKSRHRFNLIHVDRISISTNGYFPLDGCKKQYFQHLALQVSHAMAGEGDGGGTRTVTKNLFNLQFDSINL